jgi:hypothetical protein
MLRLSFRTNEFQCQPGDERHETRPLEAVVIRLQPPVIFGHAKGDQLADIDVRSQLFGASDG